MIFYAGLARLDPGDGERWRDYLRWLGRGDLERVVTLDTMLCPPVVSIQGDADWEHVVAEDFMLDFFTDLGFVEERAARVPRSLVVAAAREPSADTVAGFASPRFDFAGFDLVEVRGGVSALLNCGGFPDAFSLSELSPGSGLLPSRDRAFEVRETLQRLHPDEPHARCQVWALWNVRDA